MFGNLNFGLNILNGGGELTGGLNPVNKTNTYVAPTTPILKLPGTGTKALLPPPLYVPPPVSKGAPPPPPIEETPPMFPSFPKKSLPTPVPPVILPPIFTKPPKEITPVPTDAPPAPPPPPTETVPPPQPVIYSPPLMLPPPPAPDSGDAKNSTPAQGDRGLVDTSNPGGDTLSTAPASMGFDKEAIAAALIGGLGAGYFGYKSHGAAVGGIAGVVVAGVVYKIMTKLVVSNG